MTSNLGHAQPVKKMLDEFNKSVGASRPRPLLFSKSNLSRNSSASALATKLQFDDTLQSNSSYQSQASGPLKRSILADSEPFPKKRAVDFAEFDMVKKQLRDKEVELIDYRQQISQLELKLIDMESSLKKAEVQHDAALNKLRYEGKSNIERMEDLEHELQRAHSDYEDLIETHESVSKENNRLKSVLTQTKLDFMQQKTSFENQLQASTHELQSSLSQLQQKFDALNSESELKDSLIKNLEEDLEQMNSGRNLSFQPDIDALQSEMQVKTQELEALQQRLARENDYEKLWNQNKQRLSKLGELERECERLREENLLYRQTADNVSVLQEQITSLELQREKATLRASKFAQAQAQLDKCSRDLDQWKQTLQPYLPAGDANPYSIAKFIDELRLNELQLKSGLGDLNLRVRELVSEKENVKLAPVVESDPKLEETVKNLSERNKSLLRRNQLLTREKECYASILSQYEREVTSLDLDSPENKRIQELEALLEYYRAQLNLRESETAPKESLEPSWEAEKEQLMAKVNDLELIMRISGAFDPRTTKVLHFKDNPVALLQRKREEHLEFLEKENDALKERVRLLQEGQTQDLTMNVASNLGEANSKQVQNLQSQLESAELRFKRVTEQFTTTLSSYREAIHDLTGYKIDRKGDSRYLLTSMFSESTNDILHFEIDKAGNTQLIDSSYASEIGHLVESNLNKYRSVPVFLATHTLDLFQKTTVIEETSSTSFG